MVSEKAIIIKTQTFGRFLYYNIVTRGTAVILFRKNKIRLFQQSTSKQDREKNQVLIKMCVFDDLSWVSQFYALFPEIVFDMVLASPEDGPAYGSCIVSHMRLARKSFSNQFNTIYSRVRQCPVHSSIDQNIITRFLGRRNWSMVVYNTSRPIRSLS